MNEDMAQTERRHAIQFTSAAVMDQVISARHKYRWMCVFERFWMLLCEGSEHPVAMMGLHEIDRNTLYVYTMMKEVIDTYGEACRFTKIVLVSHDELMMRIESQLLEVVLDKLRARVS